MEFLRSFPRRHLAGKPVVAAPNVGCFLRLLHAHLFFGSVRLYANCSSEIMTHERELNSNFNKLFGKKVCILYMHVSKKLIKDQLQKQFPAVSPGLSQREIDKYK